jgi:sarcosine oxidase subunit gamma
MHVNGSNASTRVVLSDLSSWPRAGLIGHAAIAYLEARSATIPDVNAAARQRDGSLLARVRENEFIGLANGPGALSPAGLPEFALGGDNETGYCPVARFAGNAWFSIAGEPLPELFAKVCGVDLRPKAFANLSVAQTIVARAVGTVVRDDVETGLRFHLLVETSMADYIWDVLCDAMIEFDGQVSGAQQAVASAAPEPEAILP